VLVLRWLRKFGGDLTDEEWLFAATFVRMIGARFRARPEARS
jgi:hypothetical protein